MTTTNVEVLTPDGTLIVNPDDGWLYEKNGKLPVYLVGYDMGFFTKYYAAFAHCADEALDEVADYWEVECPGLLICDFEMEDYLVRDEETGEITDEHGVIRAGNHGVPLDSESIRIEEKTIAFDWIDWEQCYECKRHMPEQVSVRADGGRVICTVCKEANYFTCKSCEVVVHRVYEWEDAPGICDACPKE